jgi:putative hydrolase of the HAD superfamily
MQALVEHIRKGSAPLLPIPTDTNANVRPIAGIRAVLFDVYGTLFVSGSGDISLAQNDTNRSQAICDALSSAEYSILKANAPWADLLHEEIQRFRQKRSKEGIDYPEVCIQSVWKSFVHNAAHQNWLLPNGQLDAAIVDFECRVNPCWPMPHALDVIKALQQSDFQIGIISNAQFYTPLLFQALMNATPQALGFSQDLSIWSYQQLVGKPSTELYTLAAERLRQRSIFPEQTLFVGNDMRNDIWPAAQIGFKTVLFAGDRRSLRLREDHPPSAHTRPDLVLTDLRQLIEALSMGH